MEGYNQGHHSTAGKSPFSLNQHSFFAQLVDLNEGTDLKFVPSSMINGVECTQLVKSDVEDEIRYWQSAALCSIMGAKPPFEVMKGFFKRIWTNFEIDRILYVRKGVFLVRFAQIQDKIAVEKRGVYFFDSKPMLVKGWNPSMDLQTESIRSLPVCVQLHALDIKYWRIDSLSKIGSILGIPLKTDKFTKDKQVIRYARHLVDMQLDGPFPEYIDFFNEDRGLIRQQVSYEWIPTKCTHCAMLGHMEDVCKKKGIIRTEWRKKSQSPAQPSATLQREEHHHTTQTPQLVITPTSTIVPNNASTKEVCPTPSRMLPKVRHPRD